ncbi:TetR/AcrR family transcriptional regulator [Streptococcus pyogenes]
MTKTSQRIIETAETLFYKHGFGNVGVDTIRDEAQCSKTTMYNNFGSKEQLIVAVLIARDERFKTSLTTYIGESVQGIEAIMRLLEWHQHWFDEPNFNGCLFIRASSELDTPNTQIKAVIKSDKQWIMDLITEKVKDNSKALLIMILLEGLISINLIFHHDKDYCKQAMVVAEQQCKGLLD